MDQQNQMPSLIPRTKLRGNSRGWQVCSKRQTMIPEMVMMAQTESQSAGVKGENTSSRLATSSFCGMRNSRPEEKYGCEKSRENARGPVMVTPDIP